MRLFITYASEDRSLADELAVRLRTEGHTVFLDQDDLPEAEGYDARIREAIAACQLYLFLVSPQSLKTGRYTLTELKFAREQFPNPRGRVLPVMIQPTPFSDIPAYLGAVTVLQPKGNVVAETVAEVDAIEARHKRIRLLRLGSLVGVVVIGLAGLGWWWRPAPSTDCQLTIAPVGQEAMAGLALDVTTPAGTRAYKLAAEGVPVELPGLARSGEVWNLMLRGRDGGALGERALTGCPKAPAQVDFGGGYVFELHPAAAQGPD